MKKAFIKSYGCQMNAYDAERMADLLAREGYGEAEAIDEADLLILNTCHIREKAAEKVFSELGRLRRIKDERARAGLGTKVVVAGCVAQAEGGEILRRSSVVDVVVGPQSYHRLPALLARADSGRVVDTAFPVEDKFDHLPRASRERTRRRGVSAFLTIQEGCDRFCTFCVVPYTRGAEVSRPVATVRDEARSLLEADVREITLIGQNVNAYHGEGPDGHAWSLARLLRHLAEVEGVPRLRYTTSHPCDVSNDLIDAHRDLSALMPYLHLPVQSGSDRVLSAMNRRHTGDGYRRIIDKVRDARPGIALSSDFIVGFPGESRPEFDETLRLVADIGFAAAFAFKYSPRPGTPAAEIDGQIAEDEKSARLAELQAMLDAQRHAFNRGTVGRTLDVLLEKPGRHPGQLAGKTPYLQAVQLDGNGCSVGDIRPVTITALATNSLFGEVPRMREAAAA